MVVFWQKCIAVLTSAGNAPVFSVEVWPYLTTLQICLYIPSDVCPRMTETVMGRLTPRIPPAPFSLDTGLFPVRLPWLLSLMTWGEGQVAGPSPENVLDSLQS